MIWVALETGVGHPVHIRAVLKILGQSQCILSMPLSSKAEGLDTEEQLLGGKGIESGTQIAKNLDTGADDKGDRAKGLPELEAVVALGRLNKLWEAGTVLAPVKLARVDNHAANGGAVATNPLGSGVNNDVGAVIDGTDEVTSCAKGVVNLYKNRQPFRNIDTTYVFITES